MVVVDNIPEEFKKLKQWVLWRSETRDGNATKIPYQLNGLRASSTNPDHWVTFAEILDARPAGYTGVGFVFTKDDPYVGIDLDDCRDPETGVIAEWAAYIIDNFGSYAEISPSQCGVKIWSTGELPQCSSSGQRNQYKTGAVEMYRHSRFFTVTGQQV